MHELNLSFEGRPVRVVDRNGEPWWVAVDVCDSLGLTNPSVALQGLDDDERDTLSNTEGITADRRAQAISVINESGLYSLILRSRKPEAKRFKRWVTHEVLPAIRKTGTYASPVGPTIISIEQVRDAIRAELAKHSPGVPLDTHRIYLAEFLDEHIPRATRETKLRFKQLSKLLAEEHGITIFKADATAGGRLYVQPDGAWILTRAVSAIARQAKGQRDLFDLQQEAKRRKNQGG